MAIRNNLPDIKHGKQRLQRRIDRLFDDFFQPMEDLLFLNEETDFSPACDVEENDSHFLISFDLPGVKKDEVKIDLRDNQLTVSGERKEEHKGRASSERYHGAFCRSFTLPSNVNTEKAEATYENGVLQIALPKTAVSASKQIPIKEGKLIETKTKKAA